MSVMIGIIYLISVLYIGYMELKKARIENDGELDNDERWNIIFYACTWIAQWSLALIFSALWMLVCTYDGYRDGKRVKADKEKLAADPYQHFLDSGLDWREWNEWNNVDVDTSLNVAMKVLTKVKCKPIEYPITDRETCQLTINDFHFIDVEKLGGDLFKFKGVDCERLIKSFNGKPNHLLITIEGFKPFIGTGTIKSQGFEGEGTATLLIEARTS